MTSSKKALATLLGAALAALTGAAHADIGTLSARDYNLDGIADAYYDSASNLTWLADANYAKTLNPNPTGSYQKPDGSLVGYYAGYGDWTKQLTVGGVSGWRLPSLQDDPNCVNVGAPRLVCNQKVIESTSELSHLLHETLGNPAGGAITNYGPFSPAPSGLYWTSKQVSNLFGGSTPFWVFNATNGNYQWGDQSSYAFAWAVHDGDVAAVPEPGAFALTGMGCVMLALARRRRSQAAS